MDVRLSRKVSEDTLREIAYELRDSQPRKYKRMFIVYYLPDMTPGTGGWAISHFDPDLKIQILGMTAEEEQVLKREAQKEEKSKEVIGIWIDEGPGIAGKITMWRDKGTVILQYELKGGGTLKKREMLESKKSGLRKYTQKGDNQFGEYFVIDGSGNLNIYDDEGLVKTLKSMR